MLESAATSLAEIAFFIESKRLPLTAKKFVAEAFEFFDKLSDESIEHRPCIYERWRNLDYRCVTYKKNTLSLLSARQRKLSFVILFLHGYWILKGINFPQGVSPAIFSFPN